MNLVDLTLLAEDPPTQGNEGGGGGSNMMLLVMLVGVVALFWYMSRRSKKQQGKVEDFRNTLGVGTRVMTVGGMIGVVSAVHGDIVTLRSPSGDETAYTKRAIREAVTDDMWDAMLSPPVAPEFDDQDDVVDEPAGEEPHSAEPEDDDSGDPAK